MSIEEIRKRHAETQRLIDECGLQGWEFDIGKHQDRAELLRVIDALVRIVYEYVDPFQIEKPEDVAIVEAVLKEYDDE